METIAAAVPPPPVSCLQPVQVIAGPTRQGRGLLVAVGLDGGTLRTAVRLGRGEVLVVAAYLDGRTWLAAAAVSEVQADRYEMRFAAMEPSSRAALARYVFSRLRPPRVPGAGEPTRERQQPLVAPEAGRALAGHRPALSLTIRAAPPSSPGRLAPCRPARRG